MSLVPIYLVDPLLFFSQQIFGCLTAAILPDHWSGGQCRRTVLAAFAHHASVPWPSYLSDSCFKSHSLGHVSTARTASILYWSLGQSLEQVLPWCILQGSPEKQNEWSVSVCVCVCVFVHVYIDYIHRFIVRDWVTCLWRQARPKICKVSGQAETQKSQWCSPGLKASRLKT